MGRRGRAGRAPKARARSGERRTRRRAAAPLDVHPRVAMRILRHAQIDVTMNVYTEVSDARTLKALKRLGRQLGS
jgi:integrase